ncbi:hypothetical protein Agub_g4902, partial [Astrephomene gubernaculifera]
MTTVFGARRTSAGPAEKSPSSDRLHPEDATVLLPTTLPPPIASKADAVWRLGKYVFRADFDSANLDSVEQGVNANEFFLRTRRDCEGTTNEKATRTWFYFSICGHNTYELLILTILNLNKQSRLYSQDYRPVFWSASQAEWQPLRLKVTYRREGEDFQLRFCHRFESDEETLFAFAIPFSYQQTQDMLNHLDEQLPCSLYGNLPCAPPPLADRDTSAAPAAANSNAPSTATATAPDCTPLHFSLRASLPLLDTAASVDGEPTSRTMPGCSDAPASSSCGFASPLREASVRLYYRRQLLTRSLEGRRVDLITITDCSGATGEREPPLAGVFMQDPGPPAALFRDKTVFFISSRVHPGETPATHMFNGMLAFLLRRNDPRAVALRRRFVFKLVPLVNPDGVAVGNYRTDTLGQNLNRFYNGVPDEKTQPTVYGIKRLLMYYAQQNLLEYYIDLHAHANKKGVFIYGNTLEDGEAHLQSLMYAKLVALNNPVFDFMSCNYTEKNMSRADKDGSSKEGAGRVALYRETGLTHLYTIEANYNTARTLNVVAPATGDHGGRASPPCNRRFPARFTVSSFQAVGRAFLVACLDMEGANPWSRLPHCEHRSLEGVRSWILTVLRATPETRAAHLPPMSDAAVETLRGMLSSGSLRVSVALASGGLTRHRSTGYDSPASSVVAHSPPACTTSVAFGRGVGTHVGRRLPAPSPARRSNASLPIISSIAGHCPPTMATSSGIPARRTPPPSSLSGASNGNLSRSSSLPGRCSTPLAARQSQRSPPAGREAGCELSAEPSPGCHELDGTEPASAAAPEQPPHLSDEASSDSDGDEVDDDAMTLVAPNTPTTARFRGLDSPLKSMSV